MGSKKAAADRPRKRVAVFASHSANGLLPPQALPYLAGLRQVSDAIVFVCDGELLVEEFDKLASFACHLIMGRHGEDEFGSYRRGFVWAREHGLLDDADDVILCDDSRFGPVGSFAPMFAKMEARGLDFWGASDSNEGAYHLQGHFVVLGRAAFTSAAFRRFIAATATDKPGLTKSLQDAGFTVGAMVESSRESANTVASDFLDATQSPLHALQIGLPFVEVSALRASLANLDGPNRVLAWLKQHDAEIYDAATSELDIRQFEQADEIAFSLIMPSYNRARCIARAIAAVMAQTHEKFELIVIDDGSTDGTEALVTCQFGDEIARGRLRYIRLPENVGVCNARNIGLAHARNSWIGYADSDNELRPYFLTAIANAIVEFRGKDAFYGQAVHARSRKVAGRAFDREDLRYINYIDLGVFVHRRSLLHRFGGFDPDLRRLVDWDLIIRFTHHQDPLFIPRIFLEYADDDISDRISNRESFLKAFMSVKSKHSVRPTVSTVILGYNHQEYIAEAIESALAQQGSYWHEIILSDDGSTDETGRIMADYARKYPRNIRDVSRSENFGVSENYRHCFREAAGNFVAVLEGDDYWADPEKNVRQAEFLLDHEDAMLVFSRIELLDMVNDHRRLLNRQEGLGPLLTGADFARNKHLNLIGNFSSVMIRRAVAVELPAIVYEPRLSEIALAFYLDRLGRLGFIDAVMGVYRLNPASVWNGASQVSRLEQAIAVRESTLRVARSEYRPIVRQRLDEKKRELRKLAAPSSPAMPRLDFRPADAGALHAKTPPDRSGGAFRKA